MIVLKSWVILLLWTNQSPINAVKWEERVLHNEIAVINYSSYFPCFPPKIFPASSLRQCCRSHAPHSHTVSTAQEQGDVRCCVCALPANTTSCALRTFPRQWPTSFCFEIYLPQHSFYFLKINCPFSCIFGPKIRRPPIIHRIAKNALNPVKEAYYFFYLNRNNTSLFKQREARIE